MIYHVGIKGKPTRKVKPDVGDILVVHHPDGGIYCYKACPGRIYDPCPSGCPMCSRFQVGGYNHTINHCGYAELSCGASAGYHWEIIPYDQIMEDLL